MEDKIIIGIVVAVVLGAHALLFLWIKFKIDEGAIIKFLKDSQDNECGSVESISLASGLSAARVSTVCIKSKAIKNNAVEKELWGLH